MGSLLLLPVLVLASACDDDPAGPAAPAPSEETGAIAGVVIASGSGKKVAGAVISVGEISGVSGADGRFELTGLPAGPITIRATATGFEDFQMNTTVPGYRVTRDVPMKRFETFEFGDYALFAPANAWEIRTVLVALGGPDTRGFATNTPFGAPVAEVEAALQDLGEQFRALARNRQVAILGTSLAAMPNGPQSDAALLDALREAATLSGRPELADAPVLLYGMSGGAPQASGFLARNPERVTALFLKVPAGIEPLSGEAALAVPAYLVLAELDTFVDNDALTETFRAIRSADGLWARVLERNVVHHSLSPHQRTFTIGWLDAVLDLRLGRTGSTLKAVPASAGWLADPETGTITSWADYALDRSAASWLPSETTAVEWQTFGAIRGPSGYTVVLDPRSLTVSVGRIGYLTAHVFDRTGKRVEPAHVQFSSNAWHIARPYRAVESCEPRCGNQSGVLAVSEGKVTITAEYEGATDDVEVTVVPATGLLVIEPEAVTIPVSGYVELTVRFVDADGTEIDDPSMQIWWSSSDGWWEYATTAYSVVPDTNGRTITVRGLSPGVVTYYAEVFGLIGPDPTSGRSVITIE